MSVLYPLTLRRDCTHSPKTISAFRFLFLFLIATISFQVSFAQDTKEIQNRKEAELKKQEQAELDAKEKMNQPGLQVVSAQQKKNILDREAADAAKIMAERRNPSLPGVEYKVVTTGTQVEYVITNAGRELYRHTVSTQGSLYSKQVQAEKEAIYASNILRINPNYPTSSLQSEIGALSNSPVSGTTQTNRTQRINADYTFNGGGGSIPAGPGTGSTTGDPANPYPAIITVSGVPAGAIVKNITINGLSHTFPDDIDIVLQSPTGTNVILMSDCGLSNDLVGINYTFSDAAATGLDDNNFSPSGTYKPTNFGTGDNWPAPGPLTAPSSVTLSTFGNGNQNGTWSLFIVDDAGIDIGSWTSWSITFTDPPPVCFPIVITGQPSNTSICSGSSGSFDVVAGPNGISYNWQVNTGSGFTYITNGGVYSGATTAALTITNPTPAMNGYQYRVVITCSGGGLPEISNPATLTVLASPASPILTPSSAAICPGGNVQLLATQASAIPPSTFSSGPISVPITDFTVNTSTINVTGLPAAPLAAISVNFTLTHTFDGDLNINLVAPNGAIFNLVNRRGSGGDNFTNTIISSSSTTSLSTGSAPYTGTFAADGASAVGIAPYVATVTAWSGLYTTANGNWTLAISDHGTGDIGTLTSWSITLTPAATVNAVWSPATGLFNDAALTSPYVAGTYQSIVYASPAATTTYSASVTNGTCNSTPATATVTVNAIPVITAQPSNGAACIGSVKTFSVTATGTGLTYQWQVDMGSGYANITTGTPTNPGGFLYTGQTTATLSINTLLATMNGYKYRVVVSGTCTPSLTSTEVVLAVNSLPGISVTKSSSCSPMTLTASGASTYSWAPSAGLSATTGATVSANPTVNTVYTVTGTSVAGCVNTAQVDVKFTPAAPVVAPTAPIICSGAVQQLSITSSSLGSTTPVTTSSGAISLAVDNLLPPAISTLNVSGVAGSIQSISVNFNITHTFDGDIIINLKAPNGNIYNLVNRRGSGGDNFVNTTISSTATAPVSGGAAPFTGTYSADGASTVGISPNQSNVTAFSSLYSTANGDWTLIVSDHAGGDVGTLNSWSITLNYGIPDAGIWTPVTGLFTNAAGTTPYVAGTPVATVYASPSATTTYSVTVTNTSTETRTVSTGSTVTIPGVAPGSTSGVGDPYPSVISVSGLPANAILKSVTVKGLKHSGPDDIDMLLQSPTGVNVVLMSDVGGLADLTGQNYTFDDAAAGLMADNSLNASGTYKPTNYLNPETYPILGPIDQANPSLSLFTGDPNGTWSLYMNDDGSSDIGVMSSWELTFTIPTATNCTSAPKTVTVTVQSPITFTTQPQNRAACQNSTVTFTAAATGTITTTQWEVSTNGGSTWAPVAGATTTTLTLTNVQPSMSGYRYRLGLSNAGCGTVYSTVVTLTVNPLPTVNLTLNPGGQTALKPGMLTTVTVSSTPAGASYQWFVNGVAQPQITGSSYVVDAYHLGTYTVRVTDVNGCVNTSAGVTFTAIPTSQLFIYPNPTTGPYYVTYYTRSPMPVTITVIDMKGRRIVQRQEPTTGPYTRFDFTSDKLAAGVYVIEFRDASENLLATGRLVVNR